MNSRDQILRDIRAHLPVSEPLPNLNHPWSRYENPISQFLEILRGVGGAGQTVQRAEAGRVVAEIAAHLNACNICSTLPEFHGGNVEAAAEDPHKLADVDLAILPGELAVAENAAIWVTGRVVPQRVAYFLSQHVVLVVPADRIVHNMHEAYEWLYRETAPNSPFGQAQWGTFMSGPSKTADIEQALVIGAHGARSLHVLLLED